MKRLVRNRVKCLRCETIIESNGTYDKNVCKCGRVMVDGGLNYVRILGDPKDFEDLSVWIETDKIL